MAFRLCVLVLAGAILRAQEQPVGRGVNFYSQEKEAALGAHLATDMRQRTAELDSAPVHDYVDQLGRRLLAQLPEPHFTYTFTVVTDALGGATHEPVAIPGGHIFVPTSLIVAVRSEAEFAGMLAHAIAHVAARHGTRLATRGEIANMASIPLIYMGGWSGNDALIPIGFRTFHRQYEIEADRLAVKLMSGAGYDPGAFIRYLARTQPANTDVQKAFSVLPTVADRTAIMEQTRQELPARTYSADDGIQTIQDEVRRLNPPPKPPSLLR